MKVISGTFEKGCGVIVRYGGEYYHLIVFEDSDGKPFVEIRDKRIYENQEEDQEEKKMITDEWVLTYEGFKQMIPYYFMDYVPDKYKDYVPEIRPVNKTNEVKDSLILKKPKTPGVFPTVYINDMYDTYMQNRDFRETLQYYAEMMTATMESPRVSAMKLDFATAKDNIVFQLINTAQNEKLLAEVPHRSFLDLSVIYRWVVTPPDDTTGLQTALVRNETADQLGLTEEQLFELATANTARLLPPHVENMSDMLKLSEDAGRATGMCMMYIISNKYHIYGAETVLYEQMLYDLSRRAGGSLYVFPSSVHEWIAIPAILNKQDLEYLSEMIYSINMTHVSLNERLSNQVYFYDPEERQLMRVTDTNKKLDGDFS